MSRRWPWARTRAPGGEAQAHLERLQGQDLQVEQLGRELREYRRRNNFSGMVWQAMHRSAQEGR